MLLYADNKGSHTTDGGNYVDIRFASGKKVPVLSNLKTNSKWTITSFFCSNRDGC